MGARECVRATLLAGAIALSGSCGNTSATSGASQAPLPTTPTSPSTPAALAVSASCLGPFRPGDYAALACFVFVQDAADPPSTNTSAYADLRVFGGPADLTIPSCPACGGPPWTFDLDIRIPADISPGVKSFPVWATDAQGRNAGSTASIQIVAR